MTFQKIQFQFNVENAPPTKVALAEALTGLNEAIGKWQLPSEVVSVLYYSFVGSFFFCIFLLTLPLGGLGVGHGANLVGLAIYAACLLGSILTNIFVQDKLFSLKSQHSKLLVLSEGMAPDVLDMCMRYNVLAGYQSEVAKQGRMLVCGEVEAMRSWIQTKPGRDALSHLQLPIASAC